MKVSALKLKGEKYVFTEEDLENFLQVYVVDRSMCLCT